jgi:hypothetical protein
LSYSFGWSEQAAVAVLPQPPVVLLPLALDGGLHTICVLPQEIRNTGKSSKAGVARSRGGLPIVFSAMGLS